MSISPQETGVCPIFVGRQFDLTTIRLLIDRLRGGQGQALLVSGEAGIGKSRLVAETRATAAAYDIQLFQGNCFQTDRSSPYAPLLDLFRAALAQTTGRPLDDTLRPVVAELAELLPEIGWLFPDLSGAATAPAEEDSEQRKRRLFATLTRFFTTQATQRPIMVVIEDVHWSDDLSLEYLTRLARQCQQTPLLLLMTYRGDESHPRLRQWLAALDRERLAQELTVERLTNSDVAAMTRAVLGIAHDADPELLSMLYARAEGNPFFVEELLKSLMTAGELTPGEGVWRQAERRAAIPRSVHEAVQQRMAYLSDDAKRLLTLASVAGRRFDVSLLSAIMQCDEATLLALLREVMAAQLVTEEAADHFAFRHVLTQQAIAMDLLVRERRTLHRAIAEALEQRGDTHAPERRLEELAYHCYEAGLWPQAQAYAREAGERAVALYAQQAAVDHFSRAIHAAHHLGQTPPAQVYAARGRAYDTLGDFERAHGDYERALDAAREVDDGALQWQSMLALGFLWSGRDYAQAGDWFRQALDLADQLGDPALRAHSLNRLGNWLVNVGRSEDGRAAHHEALALFEQRGDTRGMAESLDLLGTAYGLYGDRIQSDRYIERVIPLFRALGDTQSLSSSLANRAIQSTWETTETIYHTLRTPEENLQDATEALRLARQVGSLSAQAFAEITLAFASSFAGDMGQGLAHAREGLRIARAIEHRQWTVFASYTLASHLLLLLQPALARAALEADAPLANELGSEMWTGALAALQGQIALLEHDVPQAAAALATFLPSEREPGTFSEQQVAWVWGEVALAQGEPERALQRAERLLATAPGDPDAQHSQPIPHLLRLKGEALLALARLDEAAQALAEAQRGAEARRDASILWRVHESSTRLYLRRKDAQRAHTHAEAARQIIATHAATIDEEPLREAFLAAALAELPQRNSRRTPRPANGAAGGLSAREREVAALVAQGQTNREIAARLVVSERTAEAHVSNILGKLGFTTRAQIAAWAVTHGLATTA